MNFDELDHALNFIDKRILVVGGSSGIGNSIAQGFRARGAFVHVWGTRASASDYEGEAGSDLTGLDYAQVDVSDMATIKAYQPSFTELDVVVLSQGAVRYNKAEFEIEAFADVVDVNLTSVMACATKFFPMLQQSKGALIIVSSNAAYRMAPGIPAYNASKAGAEALTRSLGRSWAREGVRVNGIAPGFVPTKLIAAALQAPGGKETAEKTIPLKRMAQPEEIATVALFLASPLSSYVIGHTIVADGGMIL